MENYDYIPDYMLAYLHGKATEEQQKLVSAWLNDSKNIELFQQIQKIDNLTSDLHLLRGFDLQKGKAEVRKKYRANKIASVIGWVQRMAAVLFVPAMLGGGWFYFQNDRLHQEMSVLMVTQEIYTQPGTKTHLFLPDSTEVWMNSASSIHFPSAFAGNERRVSLQGEAIFKVYKNKKRPFIVSTVSMDIEAIGTEFNVSVFKGDRKFSTTLAEGKVKITDRVGSEKVMVLDPGAQLNYDTRTKTYKTENVRVQDVIAWREGLLIFNETPFYEVVAKLGRWFNADIQISDPSIVNYRFTGTFSRESLEQVMELLTLSTPISYSCSQRKILDNRTFSKQEIKIWRKSNTKSIKKG